MAKLLKSIFTPEKRKTSRVEEKLESERDDFNPPLDGRRKLSISRSGRMKQANKKRHELSLDLYGENQQVERPRSMVYHVNRPADTTRRSSLDSPADKKKQDTEKRSIENTCKEVPSPEEEIESAFEIIDKIS